MWHTHLPTFSSTAVPLLRYKWRHLHPVLPVTRKCTTPHHIKAWFSWHLYSTRSKKMTNFLLGCSAGQSLTRTSPALGEGGNGKAISFCCFCVWLYFSYLAFDIFAWWEGVQVYQINVWKGFFGLFVYNSLHVKI